MNTGLTKLLQKLVV